METQVNKAILPDKRLLYEEFKNIFAAFYSCATSILSRVHNWPAWLICELP